MKNVSLLLNVLTLALVGVLFYLHFNSRPASATQVVKTASGDSLVEAQPLKIAYVDLDSIETKYEFYKEKMSEFERKKDVIDRDLNSSFQRIENERINFLKRGESITQVEAEAFQREYTQKMQNLENQKRTKEQQIAEESMRAMEQLKGKINSFLEEYNKTRNYSYIFSYGSGVNVLFYKDSTYNITNEVIEGLNAAYQKDKSGSR